MKNITSGGVLARVSRFVPQDAIPPYRTVAEWREWQLAEGRKRSEEVNRLNHQTGLKKLLTAPVSSCFTGSVRSVTTGCRTMVSAMP